MQVLKEYLRKFSGLMLAFVMTVSNMVTPGLGLVALTAADKVYEGDKIVYVVDPNAAASTAVNTTINDNQTYKEIKDKDGKDLMKITGNVNENRGVYVTNGAASSQKVTVLAANSSLTATSHKDTGVANYTDTADFSIATLKGMKSLQTDSAAYFKVNVDGNCKVGFYIGPKNDGWGLDLLVNGTSVGAGKVKMNGTAVTVPKTFTKGSNAMYYVEYEHTFSNKSAYDAISVNRGSAGNKFAVYAVVVNYEVMVPMPQNFKAAADNQKVDLSWDAADVQTGTVKYNIYQDGNKIHQTEDTQYSVSGLNNYQTYTFSVTTVINDGVKDFESSPVSDTAIPCDPSAKPLASERLTADYDKDGITLSWDTAAGAHGYKVDLVNVTDNSTQEDVITIDEDGVTNAVLTEKDYTFENGKEYNFKVYSTHETNGNSDDFAELESGLELTLPQSASLSAKASDELVILKWDKVNLASGYNIYRDGAPEPLNGSTPITETTFTDNTVTNGQSYTYTVESVNFAGKSEIAEKPQATAEPNPVGNGYFRNLRVHDTRTVTTATSAPEDSRGKPFADVWAIVPNLDINTERLFADRGDAMKVRSMPEELRGSDFIRTTMDSKNNSTAGGYSGDKLATVKIAKDADVYVAIDKRTVDALPTNIPAGNKATDIWLTADNGWEKQTDVITDVSGGSTPGPGDVTYYLYKNTIEGGTDLELGVNSKSNSFGSQAMYFVLATAPSFLKFTSNTSNHTINYAVSGSENYKLTGLTLGTGTTALTVKLDGEVITTLTDLSEAGAAINVDIPLVKGANVIELEATHETMGTYEKEFTVTFVQEPPAITVSSGNNITVGNPNYTLDLDYDRDVEVTSATLNDVSILDKIVPKVGGGGKYGSTADLTLADGLNTISVSVKDKNKESLTNSVDVKVTYQKTAPVIGVGSDEDEILDNPNYGLYLEYDRDVEASATLNGSAINENGGKLDIRYEEGDGHYSLTQLVLNSGLNTITVTAKDKDSGLTTIRDIKITYLFGQAADIEFDKTPDNIVKGGDVKVTGTVSNYHETQDEPVVLVVAVYDGDGRVVKSVKKSDIVSANAIDKKIETPVLTIPADAKGELSLKAFFWHGFENMRPIGEGVLTADVRTPAFTAPPTGTPTDTPTQRPEVPPNAPTGLNAIGKDGSAILSWNMVSGLEYYVYEGSTLKGENVTSPYTVTGLTNGTTYTLAVIAKNSYGSSPRSETQVTPVEIAAGFNDVGGWLESMYAEWSGNIGSVGTMGASGAYKVQYKKSSDDTFTDVDDELIRQIGASTVRVDVLGLSAGIYDLKILPDGEESSSFIQSGITVQAHDRSGYAHWSDPNGTVTAAMNQNAPVAGVDGGVGAYKNDGTLKENAIVVYVNEANKNTVEVPGFEGFKSPAAHQRPAKGIGNILNGHQSLMGAVTADHPLVIRIVGPVTASDPSIGKVPGTNGDLIGLTPYAAVATDYTGLDKRGGTDNDGGNMAIIRNGKNITIEGVGTDAAIEGWGISFFHNNNPDNANGGRSFEVRNLTFKNYREDGIGIEGNIESGKVGGRVQRVWIHNNTFFQGYIANYPGKESDKKAGDGSCDFKRGQFYTLSYNQFIGCKKTNLVGATSSDIQYHVTWHHNMWHGSSEKDMELSRVPLTRHSNIHMYNNYVKNGRNTALDPRMNAYIFSEYNYYEMVKNVFQAESKSAIKSFNDVLYNSVPEAVKTGELVPGTWKYAADRNEAAPNNSNTFGQFDTNPNQFYGYDIGGAGGDGKVTRMASDGVQAKADVIAYSGVMPKVQSMPVPEQLVSTPAVAVAKGTDVNFAAVSGVNIAANATGTILGGQLTIRPSSSYNGSDNLKAKERAVIFKLDEAAKVTLTDGGTKNVGTVGNIFPTIYDQYGRRMAFVGTSGSVTVDLPAGTYFIEPAANDVAYKEFSIAGLKVE